MPRPKKSRRICALPGNRSFGPLNKDATHEITMTLDEYETIRLIDLLGRTQEDCAKQMGVARTTVQSVYNTARKKVAESLVKGVRLTIEGGDYILCSNGKECCGKICARNICENRHCSKESGSSCGKKRTQRCVEDGNQHNT